MNRISNRLVILMGAVCASGFISQFSRDDGGEWLCSAECVVVDSSLSRVQSLGVVLGTSTYRKSEAWADMNQNCENIKNESGFGANARTQVVRSFKFTSNSTHETFTVSETSGSGWAVNEARISGILGGLPFMGASARSVGGFSYQSLDINHAQITHDVSVELVAPSPTECSDPTTPPDGQPKYVGPGHPLG